MIEPMEIIVEYILCYIEGCNNVMKETKSLDTKIYLEGKINAFNEVLTDMQIYFPQLFKPTI